MSTTDGVAEGLVRQFDRMVKRDGGSVSLLGVDDGVVRVGYAPGVDPDCEDGACVLPHVELQDLMGETLARRDPALRVVVELVRPHQE
jgi:Fe-S cluster biogenesis protein NfuA